MGSSKVSDGESARTLKYCSWCWYKIFDVWTGSMSTQSGVGGIYKDALSGLSYSSWSVELFFFFYCELVSFPVLASVFGYSYPVLFGVVFLDRFKLQDCSLVRILFYFCSFCLVLSSLSTVPVLFSSPSRWP